MEFDLLLLACAFKNIQYEFILKSGVIRYLVRNFNNKLFQDSAFLSDS